MTCHMLAPYEPGTKPRERIGILCEAQNWRCCYCGCVVHPDDNSKDGWDRPSIEHVSPLARGGIRAWENEVMACRVCNNGRARMKPDTYLAKVIEIGRWRAFKWAKKMRRNLMRARVERENDADAKRT